MKTKQKPKGTSLAAALIVVVLIIAIFSLGFYSSNGKITGYETVLVCDEKEVDEGTCPLHEGDSGGAETGEINSGDSISGVTNENYIFEDTNSDGKVDKVINPEGKIMESGDMNGDGQIDTWVIRNSGGRITSAVTDTNYDGQMDYFLEDTDDDGIADKFTDSSGKVISGSDDDKDGNEDTWGVKTDDGQEKSYSTKNSEESSEPPSISVEGEEISTAKVTSKEQLREIPVGTNIIQPETKKEDSKLFKSGGTTYTAPKEVYDQLFKDGKTVRDSKDTTTFKTSDGSIWTSNGDGSWTKTSGTTENFGTEKSPIERTTETTITTYAANGKISGSETTTYKYDSQGTLTKTTTDVYDSSKNTNKKTIKEITAEKTTTTVITYDATTGEPLSATVDGVPDASVLKWARTNWRAGQVWDALESAARGGIGKFFSLFMKDEDLQKWQEDIDEFLCSTIIAGGIECWTSEICSLYSETSGDGYVSIETNGLLTMAAHIEGERTKIEYLNETTGEDVVEYIYKVTYKVTNPSNSKEKMDFNVYLYGDQTVALYSGSVKVDEGGSSSRTASSAVVQDSKYYYNKVCIKFDNSIRMVNEDITEVCNDINEYGGESVPYEGEAREGSTSAGGTGDYGAAGTEVDF